MADTENVMQNGSPNIARTPRKSPMKREESPLPTSSLKNSNRSSANGKDSNLLLDQVQNVMKTPGPTRRESMKGKTLVQQTLLTTVTKKTPNSTSSRPSLSATKKRKIEELENEKTKLANAIESGVPTKFPAPDELLLKLAPGKIPAPLPEPVCLVGVSDSLIPDVVMIWDFIYMFSSNDMKISPFKFEDLLSLLQYKSNASVALTELFMALLRLLLSDNLLLLKLFHPQSHKQSQSLVTPFSGQSQGIDGDTSNSTSTSTPSTTTTTSSTTSTTDTKDDINNYSDGYNGRNLLPRSRPELLLNALTWPCFLRTVLLRLEPVCTMTACEKERNSALEGVVQAMVVDADGIIRGPNLDYIFDVSRRSHAAGPGSLTELKAVARELETMEPHELSVEHKVAVLRVLCVAAYETEFVTSLLAANAEERMERIAAQSRLEKEEKKKLKDVSGEIRERAIEQCRQVNIEKEKLEQGKNALSKGKGKTKPKNKNKTTATTAVSKEKGKDKDPYYPNSTQLAAAIEELLLLKSYNVDVVLPLPPDNQLTLEETETADNEDDNDNDEDVNVIKTRRRSTRDCLGKGLQDERKRKLQEREYQKQSQEEATERLTLALETPSGTKRIKVLREAIRFGSNAGLCGPLGERDGGGNENGGPKKVFCTELMKQAYKALADAETEVKEAEATREINKALSELFVRSEPLGEDRTRRRYWSFDGDDRLWVEKRTIPGFHHKTPVTSQLTGLDPRILAATSTLPLNTAHTQIINRRPSSCQSTWAVYPTLKDIWALTEALDDRGERESVLKKALMNRFVLEEEETGDPRPVYLTAGHDWVGRHVLRRFHKRVVIGEITGWLPAENSDPALWHVTHLDGDEEDLEEHEVEKYLLDNEEDIEPTVVSYYTNEVKGVKPINVTQIGLAGLKGEVLRLMTAVVGSLKARGSNWNREGRKDWEKGVRDAESAASLVPLLLELEGVLRSVQQEEDVQDDDDEEGERSKEQERQGMEQEGWVFGDDKPDNVEGAGAGPDETDTLTGGGAQLLGRRVRRFFSGIGVSDGVLTAFLSADRNEGEALWHMRHDDGDEEDLDEPEVLSALKHFDQDLREDENKDQEGDDSVEDGDGDGESDGSGSSDEEEQGNSDDGGSSKTLWPTARTRARWISGVGKSHTVGELALALSSLTEHAHAFGVADPMQCDNKRRLHHTAAMWSKKCDNGTGTGTPVNSGRRRKSLSHRAITEKAVVRTRGKGKGKPSSNSSNSNNREKMVLRKRTRTARSRSLDLEESDEDEDEDSSSNGGGGGRRGRVRGGRSMRPRREVSYAE
eukprot:gene7822-15997_t